MKEFDGLLSNSANDENITIIIFYSSMPWRLKLTQRPQHVAKGLAESGVLYFFYDRHGRDIFTKVARNCYVTSRLPPLQKVLSDRSVYFHIYATDVAVTIGTIKKLLAKNPGIRFIYEFVDEISPILSGSAILEEVKARHRLMLTDPDVFVVATAQKLLAQVICARGNGDNVILAPNAADVDFFSSATRNERELRADFAKIVAKKKKIIGYFGAIASWFDYELIIKTANRFPDCEIVSFGLDYDGTIKSIDCKHIENIHFLSPLPYEELPNHAIWFDVGIIPFRINDVTLSTSPIKMFEYMSMGLPIVTTAMPECKKEIHVNTAESHEEFLQLLKEALQKANDKEYKEMLIEYARQNHSWQQRCKAIRKGLLECAAKIENKSNMTRSIA